jgi:hypothetical protein
VKACQVIPVVMMPSWAVLVAVTVVMIVSVFMFVPRRRMLLMPMLVRMTMIMFMPVAMMVAGGLMLITVLMGMLLLMVWFMRVFVLFCHLCLQSETASASTGLRIFRFDLSKVTHPV